MRKPKGILYTRAGEKIAHTAESVILITSTVPEGGIGTRGEIFVDNDVLNTATYVNMVGELLIVMEEHGGENLVAQALAHYAHETGKVIHQEGETDLAYIRGRKAPEGMKTPRDNDALVKRVLAIEAQEGEEHP